MEIFLDTANINEIRERWNTGIITGITTNPTIAAKSGATSVEDYRYIIQSIVEEFPEIESVSVQPPGNTYDELMNNFPVFGGLHPSITLKLPCTKDGLRVCKHASDNGVPVNITLVFTTAQSVMSCLSGAKYVSPFVGRIDDNSFNGIELVHSISELYKARKAKTKILASSLRNVNQVSKCLLSGADVVTLSPSIFDQMYDHVLTREGVNIFNKDYSRFTDREKFR